MKDHKLNQLFAAARKETPAAPEAGFENLVLAAIRREPVPGAVVELSWFDQLGAWLPRLAWAAALVIAVALAADFALSAAGVPTLTDGVAQISEQWLVTLNGI